MRRIVMFNRVSADGYFASADGNLDWVVPEDEIDKFGAAGTSQTDTVLFGRRTYQMFEKFWPRFLDDPDMSDPHHPGKRSPEMKAMAVFLNDALKIVFSRTLKEASWKNSRLVGEFDPAGIERLKKEPGRNIIVFGSGTIVSRLTEHALIDEYLFVVTPLLLGRGMTLVKDVSRKLDLDLREAKGYPSGNVLLHYERSRG